MDEIRKAAPAEAVAGEKKLPWIAPKIEAVPLTETAGDPTISDDGLGDGLFS